jgi:hypothetical protein
MPAENIDDALRKYLAEEEEAERQRAKARPAGGQADDTTDVTKKIGLPSDEGDDRRYSKMPSPDSGVVEIKQRDSQAPEVMTEKPFNEIRNQVHDMLQKADIDVYAEITALLEGHRALEWPLADRERLFETVVGPLKKVETEKQVEAWSAAREEAEAQGWDLGEPQRVKLIQQKLHEVTDRYTVPFFRLYDYLDINPDTGDKADEHERRGRLVLD